MASPDAHRYASALLHQYRFGRPGRSDDADPARELLETVHANLWIGVMEERLDLEGKNPVAYCKRAMSNYLVDLKRGATRNTTPTGSPTRPNQAPKVSDDPEPPRAGAEPVDRGDIDTMRARIEASGQPATTVSGALTCLTLELYNDCDLAGLPKPKSGANAAQARLWPALWFAGIRDVFPKERASATQRKRLERAGKPIAALYESIKAWMKQDIERATGGWGDQR